MTSIFSLPLHHFLFPVWASHLPVSLPTHLGLLLSFHRGVVVVDGTGPWLANEQLVLGCLMLFGWGSCPSLCQLKTPAGGRWTKLLLKYWCLITANQTCPCFQISRAAVGVILFSSDVLSTYWGGACMAECIMGGIRVETNAWQSCEPPALPAKGHIMLLWWSWIHSSVYPSIHLCVTCWASLSSLYWVCSTKLLD